MLSSLNDEKWDWSKTMEREGSQMGLECNFILIFSRNRTAPRDSGFLPRVQSPRCCSGVAIQRSTPYKDQILSCKTSLFSLRLRASPGIVKVEHHNDFPYQNRQLPTHFNSRTQVGQTLKADKDRISPRDLGSASVGKKIPRLQGFNARNELTTSCFNSIPTSI